MKKFITYSAQYKIIQNHVKPDYPNESEKYENKKNTNGFSKNSKQNQEFVKKHIS